MRGASEMAAQERRRVDRGEAGRARRTGGLRGVRARRHAVGRRTGGADRRLGHADRRHRAADDLAGRLRADRAGRPARRAGPLDGRGLRSARAHRRLSVGLAVPRGSGGCGLGRISDRGPARPNHARVRVRHELGRRGGGSRALDRGRASEDARLARRARRGVGLPVREAARGRDVRRGADLPRDVGLHDRRCLRAEWDT
jgi:hypothetical protein